MSWSYSGDPSKSPKDEIRFIIGDTINADPILQDEEINFILSDNTSTADAAYAACLRIVARYSRLADTTSGKEKIAYSQKVKQYQQLANILWVDAGNIIIPYAGGVDRADKQSLEKDDSLVQPSFRRGMMDNHRYI
jgi:hypothetical protein